MKKIAAPRKIHGLSDKILGLTALCSLLALVGCSRMYTRHVGENYKNKKLVGVGFAILPMSSIRHIPPTSGCSSPKQGETEMMKIQWQSRVEKRLRVRFPKVTFQSLGENDVKESGADPIKLDALAKADIAKMGVHLISTANQNPIVYEPAWSTAEMKEQLAHIKQKSSMPYVIIFAEPALEGRLQSNMNSANPGMPNGGMSYQTVYEGDVKFGIWSTETGEPVYLSGAWAESSGFCFFYSPLEGAMDATGGSMVKQLGDIIALILNHSGNTDLAWSAPKRK